MTISVLRHDTLRHDIPAAIVVFLVALPLCLGIALASGAPLLSGIVSGIVGGIVVGLLSGSHTSVSGPAAGLAAVVLASIARLGGFDALLAAVSIAGVLQVAFGVLRAGAIAHYVPSNVIKGLLAAIGILLILKQIPHAIGYDHTVLDEVSFMAANHDDTLATVARAFDVVTPGAVLIAAVSMLVLWAWPRTPLRRARLLPAPLCVVVLGVALGLLFNAFVPALRIEQVHLVDIPPLAIADPAAWLHLPDPAHFGRHDVWIAAFTIAVVASLETLLNVEAVDKLDPRKRSTPANRELCAQGMGNMLAGLLGGLPVTSVIVRSSVNIQSGNRTRASAVLHGVLMLASVLVLSPVLNLIPLSALAAILIMTGYKLAGVTLFRDMFRKGWSQFVPFAVTVAAIVLTDLLTGVLVGLASSLFYLVRSQFRNPYSLERYRLHIGDVIKMELPHQISFLNKATIRNALRTIPDGANMLIDASNADFIDDDVLDTIKEFRLSAAERNIRLNIVGLHIADPPGASAAPARFVPVLDKATQSRLTPSDVLQLLRDGNERFRSGRLMTKYYQDQVDATASGQHPMAVVVNCIDSRTSPEIIFDAGLGDLLTIRIAGNVINRDIIGSLEIAARLGAKLIVVKGHSSCGAVGLALQDEHAHSVGAITRKIRRAIPASHAALPGAPSTDKALLEQVARRNVDHSLADILDGSAHLRGCITRGEIGLVGAYHDIGSKNVHFGELVVPDRFDRDRPATPLPA